MTAKDREMLIRIDERTKNNEATLKKLDNTINGNGKPGMKQEFDEVKHNQIECKRKQTERKLDMKWVFIALLGLVEAIVLIKEFV